MRTLFYYAPIRSLSLGAPFRYVFLISVALSLPPTYALSFSLFGGDWESAILILMTFPIQILGVAIILRQIDRTHASVMWLGEGVVIQLKEWRGSRVYNRDGVSLRLLRLVKSKLRNT